MHLHKNIIGILTLTLITLPIISNAITIDTIAIGAGTGNPDQLKGARIAIRSHWDWHLDSIEKTWVCYGYWDASLAHWRTDPYPTHANTLTAIAFAPVLRIEKITPIGMFSPYAELSVGGSILSHNTLGHRRLGSAFEFQDLLGLGVTFGEHREYELSYHYLHYSNAGLAKPNQGIDVKNLITLAYRFA